MIDRQAHGELPNKPHTQLQGPSGELRYEFCLTRRGFSGPYSLVYRQHPPQQERIDDAPEALWGWPNPRGVASSSSAGPAHLLSAQVPSSGPPINARVPLLFNDGLVISILGPDESDPVYFRNGDADDLYFIHRGGGVLRTLLGDVAFQAGHYLYVPKGMVHRFVLNATPQRWLCFECPCGVGPLSQFRNEAGQLKMDAPYSHRDFHRPVFTGPQDEGIRTVLVKRQGAFVALTRDHSPLDAVGWDGFVYPWAFSIHDFQPKVGRVHLPPDIFGTFATEGALICSFVPRPVEWDEEAVPCPYPHASVDCDEVIFYSAGAFTSRKASKVGVESMTLHPMGFVHGPHPGAYEQSIGKTRTDELAVMVDTFAPLRITSAGAASQDSGYSFSHPNDEAARQR